MAVGCCWLIIIGTIQHPPSPLYTLHHPSLHPPSFPPHTPQDHTVSPKAPLGRLAGQRALLRQGGLLVVSCAYQWSDRVADPQLWLGGTAAEQSAAQGLARALGPSFRLVREQEVPMVMRVNDRRCEVHMAHTSIWQRVE